MMYMTDGIEMETIFGDGSAPEQGGGLMGALLGAGKRLLTGESLFMTVFTNQGGGKENASPSPRPTRARSCRCDLAELGGELICQKDSFLCAAKGVSIGIAFQKKIGVGLFGGEGFIMQRLQGDGLAFVHAGGTLHRDAARAPARRCASTPAASWRSSPRSTTTSSSSAGSRRRSSAARGCSSRRSPGPGHVWLQSLPFSRLADRIAKAIPRIGRGRKEEGRCSTRSAASAT